MSFTAFENLNFLLRCPKLKASGYFLDCLWINIHLHYSIKYTSTDVELAWYTYQNAYIPCMAQVSTPKRCWFIHKREQLPKPTWLSIISSPCHQSNCQYKTRRIKTTFITILTLPYLIHSNISHLNYTNTRWHCLVYCYCSSLLSFMLWHCTGIPAWFGSVPVHVTENIRFYKMKLNIICMPVKMVLFSH